MMLTSWSEDEQMYPSRWNENKEKTLPSKSIDWQQCRMRITIEMWNKYMNIHCIWLVRSYGQIHMQWFQTDPCVRFANVHLVQRDAFKLDHVGPNSIHNV